MQICLPAASLQPQWSSANHCLITERWISSPGLVDVVGNRAAFICRPLCGCHRARLPILHHGGRQTVQALQHLCKCQRKGQISGINNSRGGDGSRRNRWSLGASRQLLVLRERFIRSSLKPTESIMSLKLNIDLIKHSTP